ncbi:hypothetical protein [Xanthomonas pisi]|nr:hypothetical protein [Xanthomonas pisi]
MSGDAMHDDGEAIKRQRVTGRCVRGESTGSLRAVLRQIPAFHAVCGAFKQHVTNGLERMGWIALRALTTMFHCNRRIPMQRDGSNTDTARCKR